MAKTKNVGRRYLYERGVAQAQSEDEVSGNEKHDSRFFVVCPAASGF